MCIRDREEGILTIRAAGVQAHAAHPAGGRNAITAMLELLCALPLAEDPATQAIRALHRFFPYGDNEGKALGIAVLYYPVKVVESASDIPAAPASATRAVSTARLH